MGEKKAIQKAIPKEAEITKASTARNFKLPKIDEKEMMEAGVHFGHRNSCTNPRMKEFIFATRNGLAIIDVEKSAEYLKKALEFIYDVVSDGGKILFVGTKIPGKNLIKETAESLGMPYVCERWLGGTLTNFKTISSRVGYYRDLGNKRKSGELEKYTKKERHEFDEELGRLEGKFGGIKDMNKLPNAVFILDLKKDNIVAREAKRVGIPVISLCDTNTDPREATCPIPSSDDAISSIKYMLGKVADVIKQAQT